MRFPRRLFLTEGNGGGLRPNYQPPTVSPSAFVAFVSSCKKYPVGAIGTPLCAFPTNFFFLKLTHENHKKCYLSSSERPSAFCPFVSFCTTCTERANGSLVAAL